MQKLLCNFAYCNCFCFNCDFNRVACIFPCKILYIRIKCCREKHCLTGFCFWKAFKNLTKIIIKAHIKHAVSFINNTEMRIT